MFLQRSKEVNHKDSGVSLLRVSEHGEEWSIIILLGVQSLL